MKTNTIMNGDALTHLKELPDKSIDMCMTSPPYWSLRDYGVEVESVWGDDNCEHEWSKNEDTARFSNKKWKKGDEIIDEKDLHEIRTRGDSFCSKCDAWKGQLGLEPTFDLYIKHLCDLFDEAKRVLRDDGTCWINLGDTYTGNTPNRTMEMGNSDFNGTRPSRKKTKIPAKKVNLPAKSLIMVPQRFAIEMINRGWILRNTIIWHKPNCMPSSAKDRFTVDFEYLFFFSKKKKYYFKTQYDPANYDGRKDTIMKGSPKYNKPTGWDPNLGAHNKLTGRYAGNQQNRKHERWQKNEAGDYIRMKRCIWNIPTKGVKDIHFAVYPEGLCETPIKACCPREGIVLDPFFGSGTTGIVALKQDKNFIGIELNPEYIKIANKRLKPYLEQTKLTDLKKREGEK